MYIYYVEITVEWIITYTGYVKWYVYILKCSSTNIYMARSIYCLCPLKVYLQNMKALPSAMQLKNKSQNVN